jgi:putative spermidine/putrescine transport system ATP-binding protein
MSGLVLDGIAKSFGTVAALHELSLTIPQGKFVCLLGPSGCGKTTLLRLIAGLDSPSAGRIRLDGADITELPAHRRDFGMVFQSLALFPHLSVGENIAYPLRIRGASKADQTAEVARLLDLVRLPGIADRPVSRLSGGQRQRVAIARALALKPKLFLLDEPLSALDAKLREAMQIELKLLQERLGITTIVVTHDQREAMTMADLVVVMSAGRIQQAAPPVEVYCRPVNAFVADFIGTTNLLRGRVVAPGRLGLPAGEISVPGLPADGGAAISVRPENLRLHAGGDGENRVAARVTFIRDLGATVEMRLDAAGQELILAMPPAELPELRPGAGVFVELPAAACVVLSP